MVTPVNNPALLRWLQDRGAFGGQYGSPNQGTQLASLASPASQQGNVRRQLLFDAPVSSEAGSDQTRVDNFGSGVNPYSKPGSATLAGGFQRWIDNARGNSLDHLSGTGFGDNPINRLMDKYNPRWEGRPRTGGLSGLGDAAMLLGAGQIPGASLLTAAAGLFNKLGAHHEYNPARDSNLFYETDRGRITYDSMDPGGGGEQAGTLNAYNLIMSIDANDPDREIQTEQGWAKAKDLAEAIKNRPMGEQGWMGADEVLGQGYSTGLFTEQPTNFAQMSSQYKSGGENMSNEDAVRSLDTRYGDAWNEIAAKAYEEGRGYEGAVADAAKAAQELRANNELDSLIGADYKGPITLDRAVKEASVVTPASVWNPALHPADASIHVDTTDPVDDAWDSGDFGFSSDEMSFDGII